jgi:DNA topoisomerase-2
VATKPPARKPAAAKQSRKVIAADTDDGTDESFEEVQPKSYDGKTIEQIYQKKTPLEHVLLRPDTYVGSIESREEKMWVYDEVVGMNYREISYVPGLYKIFDEILVNAADNFQRDKTMDKIQVTINADTNTISVWNNGQGVPLTS